MALLLLSGCTHRAPHRANTPIASPAASDANTQDPTPNTPSSRLWTKGTEDVPVIMYHDVVPRKEVWFDLSTREFARQMAALKDAGANVVPLTDVVEHLRDGKPLPAHAIALTFDDGTLGDYTYAAPLLKQYGYPATFFVHTGYVGVPKGKLSDKDHMTWDQLRELQGGGLIDVQPHTTHHPEDLRLLSDDAIRQELSESNDAIQREMGHKPRFFAYPAGNGDERVAQLVEQAGYEAAWNEVRAWDTAPADRLFLPRFAPFRLDDILGRWEQSGEGRVSGVASYTLSPQPATEGGSSGQEKKSVPVQGRVTFSYKGVRIRWQATGQFPDIATPYAYTGSVSFDPDMGGAGSNPRGEFETAIQGIRVEAVLFDDIFKAVPDVEQWSGQGRPLLLADPSHAVFLAYQPWMGVSQDSLNVVMPGVKAALLCNGWLLHQGRPRSGEQETRLQFSPAFIGVDGANKFILGRVKGRIRTNDLEAALARHGVQEAALVQPQHWPKP